MQTICGLFGYTRQAYYKSLRSNTDGVIDDCRILLHVENIRKLMPRLGTRKLHYMLQEEGVSVSRDRLFDHFTGAQDVGSSAKETYRNH